jgi:hypothetical protein
VTRQGGEAAVVPPWLRAVGGAGEGGAEAGQEEAE